MSSGSSDTLQAAIVVFVVFSAFQNVSIPPHSVAVCCCCCLLLNIVVLYSFEFPKAEETRSSLLHVVIIVSAVEERFQEGFLLHTYSVRTSTTSDGGKKGKEKKRKKANSTYIRTCAHSISFLFHFFFSPPPFLTSFPLQLETGVGVTVERNGDQFVVADSSYEVAKVFCCCSF
jgi:hypothetical protein